MNNKQNPWFVLAQILATLSGACIVGTGIFFGMAFNGLFLAKDFFDATIQYSNLNNTNISTVFANSGEDIMEIVSSSTRIAKSFLVTGILLAFFSISAWWKGCRDEKEKPNTR